MAAVPRCPGCEHPKKEQYCATCLREGIATHAALARSLRAQADAAIARADALLAGGPPSVVGGSARSAPGATAWRELRAEVAAAEARCAALRDQIGARAAAIKRARDTVVRSDFRSRQETLEAAHRTCTTSADIRAQIALVKSQQREVGKRVLQARRVLVREAVDVFGVQLKAGKGWEIAGVPLPPPEVLRLHSSVHINAAFVHTVHLLSLITRYLSVALPFTPMWPTALPHVGRPIMMANLPFLATTRWREKYALWMSSTASLAGKVKHTNGSQRQAAVAAVLTKSSSKHRGTLTAYALLAQSVAYLAWTQGVPGIGLDTSGNGVRDSDDEAFGEDTPGGGGGALLPAASGVLVPATAILELIALTAESSSLGIRAHEPGMSDYTQHLGFGLDVAKVVPSVLAAEQARWGTRTGTDGREELSEGWDLLDME